jgi:hypothetical protein
MVATAAHLTDHVVPDLPLRQWVLAVPKRLRYFLERDADLQGAALRLFLRAVESCLRAHSPGLGPTARLGAVAFIHRFGSTLNPHQHFHCVVIDGVFEPASANGVVFHAATGADATAIARVQESVRQRLLRYCARPPFALDRLRELDPEHLLYESTKQGPGGGGPLLLTPLQLLDRLAALVPPPRAHRHRTFGVLAPNAPLRTAVTALAPAPALAPPAPPAPPPAPPATEAAPRRAAS